MKRLSKIFVLMGSFYTLICSRVFGIPTPNDVIPLYGIAEPSIGDEVTRAVPIFLPIVLFVIGLYVFINKKIDKNVKIILISLFAITATIIILINL